MIYSKRGVRTGIVHRNLSIPAEATSSLTDPMIHPVLHHHMAWIIWGNQLKGSNRVTPYTILR